MPSPCCADAVVLPELREMDRRDLLLHNWRRIPTAVQHYLVRPIRAKEEYEFARTGIRTVR